MTERHDPSKAPGRCCRQGMTLAELFARFPNDEAAEAWFAEARWGGEPECPRCAGDSIQHLAHRIGKAYDTRAATAEGPFLGPVEADETYVGGRVKAMHAGKRRCLRGCGVADKTAVVGVRDRATGDVSASVVETTDAATLQGFVTDHTDSDAMVYTGDHRCCQGLPYRETVCHSVGGYVAGKAHVNGIESFWALFKRGLHGTCHQVSVKHLDRHVAELARRHNVGPLDTDKQMRRTAKGMVGERLQYSELIAA